MGNAIVGQMMYSDREKLSYTFGGQTAYDDAIANGKAHPQAMDAGRDADASGGLAWYWQMRNTPTGEGLDSTHVNAGVSLPPGFRPADVAPSADDHSLSDDAKNLFAEYRAKETAAAAEREKLRRESSWGGQLGEGRTFWQTGMTSKAYLANGGSPDDQLHITGLATTEVLMNSFGSIPGLFELDTWQGLATDAVNLMMHPDLVGVAGAAWGSFWDGRAAMEARGDFYGLRKQSVELFSLFAPVGYGALRSAGVPLELYRDASALGGGFDLNLGHWDSSRYGSLRLEYSAIPGKEAEFARQLAGQEAAMNRMTAGALTEEIESFLANGRPSSADRYLRHFRSEHPIGEDAFVRDYLAGAGAGSNTRFAALHDPDMVIGGRPANITGYGDFGVNSSIGVQNYYHRDSILNFVKSAPPDAYLRFYLEIK